MWCRGMVPPKGGTVCGRHGVWCLLSEARCVVPAMAGTVPGGRGKAPTGPCGDTKVSFHAVRQTPDGSAVPTGTANFRGPICGGLCRLDWGDVCRLLPGGHCRRTSWGIVCGAGAGAAGGGDRAPAVPAGGTRGRLGRGIRRAIGLCGAGRLGSGKTTCATETLPGSLAYRISQLGPPIDNSPEPV